MPSSTKEQSGPFTIAQWWQWKKESWKALLSIQPLLAAVSQCCANMDSRRYTFIHHPKEPQKSIHPAFRDRGITIKGLNQQRSNSGHPSPNPQVHISKFGFVRLTMLFKAVSGSCLNDNRKRGNESPFPVPERLDEGGVMTWPQD